MTAHDAIRRLRAATAALACATIGAAAHAGPVGACCLGGECVQLSMEDCILMLGTWEGEGVDCADVVCGDACCLPDGTCVQATLQQCVVQGGEFFGGFECVDVTCPENVGACCLPDSTCVLLEGLDCEQSGGLFQGVGTTCGTVECCLPPGACCLPDGTCELHDVGICPQLGGIAFGPGTICTEFTCGLPFGACCLPDGSCAMETATDCEAFGGMPGARGTTCANVTCTAPTGACCLNDGTCLDTFEDDECALMGGIYQGDGVVCSNVICDGESEACCLGSGTCLTTTAAHCADVGGYALGPATDCAGSTCPALVSCCLPDAPLALLPFADCVAAGGAPAVLLCGGGDELRCPRLFVPGDYPTIQSAVNDAFPGDEIVVGPGTYHEAVDFTGKALTLRSTDGPAATWIDATGLDRTAVRAVTGKGPDTLIEGFTITGGVSDVGGGLHVGGSSPMIRDCIVTGNTATNRGGGIYVLAGSPTFEGCIVSGNTADRGGGVYVESFLSDVTLDACVVVGNDATTAGGGLHHAGGRTTITASAFTANGAPLGPGTYVEFGALHGAGVIGDGLLNLGELRPDVSAGAEVQGDYAQRIPSIFRSGVLALDLGAASSAPGGATALSITGPAALGGKLDLDFDGSDPPAGTSYPVLAALALDPGADRFDVIQHTGLVDKFVRLVYQAGAGPAGVTVVVEDLASLFGLDDPQSIGFDGDARDLAVHDLDGAPGDDLAILLAGATPSDPGSVLVLVNQGEDRKSGELQFMTIDQPDVGPDPRGITTGDFDGDGRPDLAVANHDDSTLSILFADATIPGTFEPAVEIPLGDRPLDVLAAHVVDGTAAIDLLVTLEVDAGPDEIFVLRNVGDGTFIAALTFPAGDLPLELEPPPDNPKDRVVASTADSGGDSATVVVRGEGGAIAVQSLPVGGGPSGIALGDLDGNGEIDLAVALEDDDAVAILLQANETFGAPAPLSTGDAPSDVVALDADRDGDLDLVVIALDGAGDPIVQLLRNDLNVAGALVFAGAQTVDAGPSPALVRRGLLDDDDDDDLVVVNDDPPAGAAAAGPFTAAASILPVVSTCRADLTGNGAVDFADLLDLLSAWGVCPGCSADLDADGVVNFLDLLVLLSSWGPCP